MDFFEFESGEVLKNVNVEYMTFGTPKYDENGSINNAIVYCSGSLGTFAGLNKILPLTFENCPFDAGKYFFVSLSALGSPGSCSPSSTNLKNKFPRYTIRDVVNFQKQFLKEKFDITHILGLVGNSMGGFVGLTQAIEYPDFQDFIICGVTSFKVAGHNYVLSKFVDEIITSDPDYAKGEMTYSLIRTLRLACLAEFNFGLSKKALREKSNEELAMELEDFGNERLESDIYDLKYCIDAEMDYDVENDLGKIKSKVMIIACNQDPLFIPEFDAIPLSEKINDSELILMDSDWGHLCFNDLENISYELNDFLSGFDDC
jgi:homoserine O-acetyltransferase